ncbi:hypothetical protein ACOSQ2_013149 [Xanthoceras sorbifolium]
MIPIAAARSNGLGTCLLVPIAKELELVLLLATAKCSYDPREDFRESMIELIMANWIEDAKGLRSRLNYYMSMDSKEYHGIILEVFYEVCSYLFPFCKCD